jgi:hypothetical protein
VDDDFLAFLRCKTKSEERRKRIKHFEKDVSKRAPMPRGISKRSLSEQHHAAQVHQ